MSKIADIEMEGHLIDSLILAKALDKIMDMGGEFEIKKFTIGQKKHDTSHIQITVVGEDTNHLDKILLELHALGARLIELEDAKLAKAPANMVVPRGFYSTTNHPTYVRQYGYWIEVEDIHMDCLIVLDDKRAICTPIGHIKKGDQIVLGTSGVKVVPPERPRKRSFFSFMSNEVSSERPSSALVRQLAEEIISVKHSNGRIGVVCGPAVVHTGAGLSLAKLIRDGYVDVLLAGNAIAVHDIERQLFGTSLGMDCAGNATSGGHRNHIYAISEIMASGSIRNAIDEGKLKGGIMYECIEKDIPFILAGSIRDDGPLPEVIIDTVKAKDAMEKALHGVEMVIMMGSMLHSIAVGNLLPSYVKTICVDINPATVTKLMDRGSAQAIGLVTDIGIFLPHLVNEIQRQEVERKSDKRGDDRNP
ncbi:MAG: TIGR00300 family protein [Methanotrichaceae archaeon]|nr:TIGR00300 family protein [Methanotrichaceae archaeon]